MQLTSPGFLLLLPIVVWFWREARRSSVAAGRVALRSAAGLCLVLALCGLQVRTGEAPLAVMFVLDRSDSVAGTDAESLRQIKDLAVQMRAGDRAGVLVFGADAAVEKPLASALDISSAVTALSRTSTNIENALRLARAALATERAARMVLVSDGNETSGDAVAESARAGSAGVPIDVMRPRGQPPLAAIDVMRVSAPPTVRVGEPFVIMVTARGVPATRGTLVLSGPGGESWSESVTLASDGLGAVRFSTRAVGTGTRVYEATVRADRQDDFAPAPRRAGAVVSVTGETRILYVAATTRLIGPSLIRAGFRLDHIAAELLPRSIAGFGRYDGIVMDDVSVDRIDAAQAAALAAYVREQGGGLLFLGSRDSLEAGQLIDHAIGELLPLDLRPRSGQRAPSLGVAVVFDKSGSMDDRVDGVPRVEFARQAVRRVFDAVPASDAIGVIAFDSTPHVVAPLAAGHDPQTLISNLAAVQASGATAIAPALELASTWLREASPEVSRRHVLLVSDGRTSAADAAKLRAVVDAGGFELSVVALGADADRRLLESLARSTGGRAFFPKDIRELPAVVAREAARVAGGRLFEEPFRPVTRMHPVVEGLENTALPALGGYVVGVVKPAAESPLVSPLNDPVLATWRQGLGRVAVYTAELHGAWSASLRTWRGFDALFTQTMRWVSRGVRDDGLYASFEEDDSGLRMIVEAETAAGTPLSELDAHTIVRTPGGRTTSVALLGTAPGRYQARIEATDRGAYLFSISARRAADELERRIFRGVYWSADREHHAAGPDLALLERVAQSSGGRAFGTGENPFTAPRTRTYVALWPWLAGAALALFLAEILWPARSGSRPSGQLSVDTHHETAAA